MAEIIDDFLGFFIIGVPALAGTTIILMRLLWGVP